MAQTLTLLVPKHSRKAIVGHEEVLIDREDEALVAQFSWRIAAGSDHPYPYAYRNDTGVVLMHRLILGLRRGERDAEGRKVVADHLNGDTLDNRRANLRRATESENAINTRRRRRSGYDPLNPTKVRATCACCGSRYWKEP